MDKPCKKRAEFCKKALSVVGAAFIAVFCFGVILPSLGGLQAAYAATGGSSFIVVEQTSGRTLKGENEHARLPMASPTKIATAYVVLKNVGDIDKEFIVPKQAVGVEGSSIYLVEGETLTIRELLFGLMLRSGNDAAVALAIATSGSVESFVELMNKTAAELGLNDTSFKNPHGLSEEGHYTSAYDLAMLSRAAMNDENFKKIVSSKQHNIPYKTDEGQRYMQNKNKILRLYEGGNGIKTGYTKVAGRCLVASAERGGMQLISVALNQPDMWNVCIKLMDYGFENYKMTKLYDEAENAVYIKSNGKGKGRTLVLPEKSPTFPLTAVEAKSLETKIELPDSLPDDVKFFDNVGIMKVFCGECLLFSAKFYTMQNVD